MNERIGRRKKREQTARRRVPELGYYFIVTDTNETERNYMLGLRESIPEELQGKLVIKVSRAKTEELIDEAQKMASLHPQFGEIWIVFDRDEVGDFDKIIAKAQERNINVGWSNPCIEIWFSAYFGVMPACLDSVSCCEDFKKQYNKTTKQRYEKSDPSIYTKLCHYGNEERAIEIAEKKHNYHIRNDRTKPAIMRPCTTMYMLIREIKGKIERNRKA